MQYYNCEDSSKYISTSAKNVNGASEFQLICASKNVNRKPSQNDPLNWSFEFRVDIAGAPALGRFTAGDWWVRLQTLPRPSCAELEGLKFTSELWINIRVNV